MSLKKPTVAVSRKLPDSVETRMRELFDVRLNETDKQLDRNEIIELMNSADVFVSTITDKIDHELLAAVGPRLKLIANFGAGTDHIDVAAAYEKGVTVCNTSSVLTEDTANMTAALLISLPRRFTEGTAIMQKGERWDGWSPTWMLGTAISGKRLGIVGMGRIGTAVAHRARAFGLSIHYHNRQRTNEETEEALEATYWESLDQMLANMDFICVHCPFTPATYHLISKRRLKLLRPGAFIVNTSRGEVIDEEGLLEGLESGHLGGAGLDVLSNEPEIDPRWVPLMKQGKAVLLPHMASSTKEARERTGENVVINIKTFADGHRPPDRVLPPVVKPIL